MLDRIQRPPRRRCDQQCRLGRQEEEAVGQLSLGLRHRHVLPVHRLCDDALACAARRVQLTAAKVRASELLIGYESLGDVKPISVAFTGKGKAPAKRKRADRDDDEASHKDEDEDDGDGASS